MCLVICKYICYTVADINRKPNEKPVSLCGRTGEIMTKQEENRAVKKQSRTRSSWPITMWIPQVQEVADYIGDSFYLSRVATELSESTIVFCGVSFMGESAKILNPDKTVLMPDPAADCPMHICRCRIY